MPLPPVPQTISDEIFKILTKEDNAPLIDRIIAEHGIDEGRVVGLSAVVGHTVMGTLPLEKLAETLEEELGIDIEKAKKIAVSVLLTLLYPYWPLYPNIDEVIMQLGGRVPNEKPAMPSPIPTDKQEEMQYPEVSQTPTEEPALLGGLEIPVPPAPRSRNKELGSRNYEGDQPPEANGRQLAAALERDIPWQPQPKPETYELKPETSRNVARPGDVAKLLEKNLIKTEGDAENNQDPRLKGNVVDLSNQ